ncbi:tail fiber assembly protein [Yersinia similis]|uniref:tail fiber assembly protein n=1 Tax=Yersinia similis TaxID=367190 RepID=UPI0011A30422|nr:tail fiber assembly protein [Yersinia similis]
MKALFSPKLIVFIPESMVVDGSYSHNITDSLIAVTDEELATYWRQNSPDGKTLGVADGRPVWVDLSPPSHEELVFGTYTKKNQLKAAADSEIDWRQDAVDTEEANEKEISALAAWRKYRITLMRIDISHMPIAWPITPEE